MKGYTVTLTYHVLAESEVKVLETVARVNSDPGFGNTQAIPAMLGKQTQVQLVDVNCKDESQKEERPAFTLSIYHDLPRYHRVLMGSQSYDFRYLDEVDEWVCHDPNGRSVVLVNRAGIR